jgi:transposase
MADEELFSDLAVQRSAKAVDAGAVRLREPMRDQVELLAVDLDGLLGPDHPARLIWDYLSRIDLQMLEQKVRAREHTPGQAPASPRLLLALWLYATSEGIGSARALARLCDSHDAYRWLCGGVSVNYHGLSDFRAADPELLDRLLSEHVATLSAAGVINLDEVTQDGVRVRASAGSASFRRKKTLHKELRRAQRRVKALRLELDDDPDASNRRIQAAQFRAAREREARVKAALDRLAEIEAERERRGRSNKNQTDKQKEPRASTTDPQARVMKMPDGGYRPSHNCQIATVADGQIVVGVDVDGSGSDHGLMRPMIEQIKRRHGRRPKRYLVDGGFNKNDDTEWAAEHGVRVYGPPVRSKHAGDPYAPRRDDGPGVAAWRRRMKSPHGKGVYKRRTMGECINARFRQWGFSQFVIRGHDKVRALLSLFALANNVLQGHRLSQAAA